MRDPDWFKGTEGGTNEGVGAVEAPVEPAFGGSVYGTAAVRSDAASCFNDGGE